MSTVPLTVAQWRLVFLWTWRQQWSAYAKCFIHKQTLDPAYTREYTWTGKTARRLLGPWFELKMDIDCPEYFSDFTQSPDANARNVA